MKRFTLVISILCIAGISFGQVTKQGTPAPVKQDPVSFVMDQSQTKASGDIFWSTSFNWGNVETKAWELPAGWEIKDNTDFGNPWIWRSPYDTLGGCCTWQGPSSTFVTPLDGYIVLPADEYNRRDGVGTSNVMDTYIQTPPIDCSSKSSVVVSFKQLFRLCCGTNNLKMMVTNDGGVHWAEYSCLFGLANNRVADLRYQTVEFNISDVAAGLPNVQIRFYQTGNTHYFWMIDDLKLSEAYQNDLVLENYWQDFNGGFDDRIGHINYWPKSQMGQVSATGGNVGDYLFRGAFLNNGIADQEDAKLQVTVLHNGAQVWQDVSDASTIWPIERDTATVNTVFLASDYGDYAFQFNGLSDNTEEVPLNNTVTKGFTVTDTLFHRADFSAESASNTGGWVGGSNGGDMVGVFYDIFNTCEINAITAYISGVTISQIPQFQYVLLKDQGEDGLVEYMATEVIDATLAMRSTWVTLEIQKDGETEFLEPGLYVACVRFWGTVAGDDNGTNGMSIGWDMDNTANGYTYNYQSVGGGWFNTGKMNLIGIGINATGAPTQAAVTFNVDMNKLISTSEFNPATDKVDVSGLAQGAVAMTDADADGIFTGTMDAMPVGKWVEYSYTINGNPEGKPMAVAVTHKRRVTYFNTFSDVFNFGRTATSFNCDMTDEIAAGRFVPGTDTLEINGEGNTWKTIATLSDTDGDQIYTVDVTSAKFGMELRYKYSINDDKEAYPLTGDPYRTLMVRYQNKLNDKYNAQSTSGTNPLDVATSVRVYPNPSNGKFNVSISNQAPATMDISILNMQGQVVYNKRIADVTEHNETIDNQLSKGVYFIRINNGTEVKTQKVVVQ